MYVDTLLYRCMALLLCNTVLKQDAHPTSGFHYPGNAYMNNEASPNTFCMVTDNAQKDTSPKTTDSFAKWFSTMNSTVKTSHRYDALGAANFI